MRFLIFFMIFFMSFTGHVFAAGVRPCTTTDSIKAEGEASKLTLKTWGMVYKSFKRFSQCDGASVGEGYSEVIVELLVNDWKAVSELNELAFRDARFKQFVLHHIDELMSPEEADQIRKNAQIHCPVKAKKLCGLIINKLDETASYICPPYGTAKCAPADNTKTMGAPISQPASSE